MKYVLKYDVLGGTDYPFVAYAYQKRWWGTATSVAEAGVGTTFEAAKVRVLWKLGEGKRQSIPVDETVEV